jgi:hypothetical protein
MSQHAFDTRSACRNHPQKRGTIKNLPVALCDVVTGLLVAIQLVAIHSRRKGRATFTPTTGESFARKRRSFVDGFRLILSIPIRRDTPDSSNEILYRPLRSWKCLLSIIISFERALSFLCFRLCEICGRITAPRNVPEENQQHACCELFLRTRNAGLCTYCPSLDQFPNQVQARRHNLHQHRVPSRRGCLLRKYESQFGSFASKSTRFMTACRQVGEP